MTFLDAPGPVRVDGELHPAGAVPAEVAGLMGAALGISPACHLRGATLLAEHLAELAESARLLGYTSAGVGELAAILEREPLPPGTAHVVALVPTPDAHRSLPPGDHWFLASAPFDPPDAAALRAGRSAFARNERSPASGIQLLDDTELLAGARTARAAGFDAQLWTDLGGHLACVDQAAIVTLADGHLVTPPVACGAVRTGWRLALIQRGLLAERPLHLDDLRRAGSAACRQPWGSVHQLCSVEGLDLADTSAEEQLAAAVAGLERRNAPGGAT